jgi:polyisoprenoid-binding protein YceI
MLPAHCLILHHDPARREELVSVLREGGHRVATAPDPAAAAEAIGVPGFDVLVLDLHLPELDVAALRQAIRPTEPAEPDSLEAAERRHIALVLRHTGGNKRKAAHLLGISRSTLLHKVRKYGLAMIVAVAVLSGTGRAAAQEPPPAAVRDAVVRSGVLSFDGHATVGDFTGRTTTLSGEMHGGADLVAVRGWVEAPVKTLKTGNGKRDKDLNKSMESDQYPTMRFDLVDVVPRGGTSDSTMVTLRGALTLHGVQRQVELPAVVTSVGSAPRVRSDFPLNVKDYHVGGLSKALGILKMDEHIEVHVDLQFAPK